MSVFILSPAKCGICDYYATHEEFPLCSRCLYRFQEMLTEKCPNCGNPPTSCKCADEVRSLLFYRQFETRWFLYALKYNADRRVIEFIAKTAAEACGINMKRFDGVTYVPRLSRRKRRYGHDQSFEFAKAVSKIYGLPVVHALKRKGGIEQKLLSRSERLKNARGCYRVKSVPPEKYNHLLLVDDISTTGATMEACASILRESVAKSVTKLVIAKTVINKKQ